MSPYQPPLRVKVVGTETLPIPKTLENCRSGLRLSLTGQATFLDTKEVVASGLDDGVDANLQHAEDRISNIKLAVFDMDSTLIQCEVIDELAKQAGVGDRVIAITRSPTPACFANSSITSH